MPDRQRLNADSGLEQNFVGKIVQRKFRGDELSRWAAEKDCNVGITVRLMGAPGAAAEENGTRKVAARRNLAHESIQRRCSGGVDLNACESFHVSLGRAARSRAENIVRESEKARKLSFAGFRIFWLPDLDSNQGPAD